MSRYASYGQLDTQYNTDGDVQFKGIDMKHDRPLLEPGMVAKSINKRLRTGVAETRAGSRVPSSFNPTFVDRIVGSCVYSNPNGTEQLLVAEANRQWVWALQDGVAPKQVWIRGASALVGDWVWLVQAFDKVLLLRAGFGPLVWAGLDYGDVNPLGGFRPITKFDPADTSTDLIPNVGYGIAFQNRMLYMLPPDKILMSDVLDYTSYDPVLANFRINAGEGDRISCLHAYSKESVLVFMKRSVHLLSNFTSDPSLASQTVVNDELGAVSREAAVQIGNDVIFLSRAGFYRINQVLDTQVASAPVPISDLISPLLEGLAWENLELFGFSSMAVLGDYCYMAVPFGNNWPRNILVYNTVTSMWESVDAWEDTNFYCNQLRVTIFGGERRLFALNQSSSLLGAKPRITLLYEGITDQTTIVTNPVNDILETRGYMERSQYGGPAGATTWKRFDRLTAMIRTRNPSILLSGLTDGYNEVKPINSIPITKNPQQSYLFSMQPSEGSLGPDFPYKEDYYTGSETVWVAQDMSNLIPGFIDLLPGVDPEMLGGPKTESMERRPLRITGRWVSIRIDNRQGACDILGCEVDMREKRRDQLTMA